MVKMLQNHVFRNVFFIFLHFHYMKIYRLLFSLQRRNVCTKDFQSVAIEKTY